MHILKQALLSALLVAPLSTSSIAQAADHRIRITENEFDDATPCVFEARVVWSGFDGNDYEIYLWDDGQIFPITNNDVDDVTPSISAGGIAWSVHDGNDFEINYWDGTQTVQLTHNDGDDLTPRMWASNIVWSASDGEDFEIYLWDGQTRAGQMMRYQQLTNNHYDDVQPHIARRGVVWAGFDGNDYEIYFFNTQSILQITDNDRDDKQPCLSEEHVVWSGHDGHDWEIFLWDRARIKKLTTNEDDDLSPQVGRGRVIWSRAGRRASDLYQWDGKFISQLTNTKTENVTPSFDGVDLAWASKVDDDFEIFLEPGGRIPRAFYYLAGLIPIVAVFLVLRTRRRRRLRRDGKIDDVATAKTADELATAEPATQQRRVAAGRRRWTWRFRIAALVIGLAIGLLAAEIVIRLVPVERLPEMASYETQDFYAGVVVRPSANYEMYYELIPNQAETGINEFGYRGPARGTKKPPGTRRIVGIGDSTFFGWKVGYEESCLGTLERLLNENRTDPVQVIDLAVPGYNTVTELAMLRERGFGYDPDLIVFGYDHNDPEGMVPRTHKANFMPAAYGENVVGSQLIRYLRRRSLCAELTRLHAEPDGNERTKDGYIVGGPSWQRHLDAMAEMSRLARERGIPIVVVVYETDIDRDPERASEHYQKLHRSLLPFWKEHGFYVVDCYDLFQTYMAEHGVPNTTSLWINPQKVDRHPNPAGHAMMAEAIFELIQREGLVP